MSANEQAASSTPPKVRSATEEGYIPKRPPPLSDTFAVPKVEDDSDTTATDSSDEFNWDEDEEKPAPAPEVLPARRVRWLYLTFLKLARTLRVLLVGLLGAAILVAPLLVVNLRFKENPAKLQVHVWSLWLTIVWSTGVLTYLLVDYIPNFVVGMVGLFGGQIERLKSKIELTMAVKAWLKLALDITWAWIALSVIRAFYHPPGTYWTTINRVMQALFSAGLILFVEKLLLQSIAINFHEKALADRIAENQLGLKALDRLSNAQPAAPTKRPANKRGHKSSRSVPAFDNVSSAARSEKEAENIIDTNRTNTSPTGHSRFFSPKPSGHPRRKKKKVTSVIVDHVGQMVLKNSKLNQEGDFTGLYSARRLARKLFAALSDVNPPRAHLVVDDFFPYFRSTAEAHEAFAVFDKDGNGDITKPEMREAVQRIYRERKALVGSLKDVDSIVAKLDAVLICVSLVLVIFVCLLIFNRSNTLASLVPLATIILGFSFIFGHSAQTLFESLIFIFSTHVFDVGDLVMIDDQILFVKEFGLFATTFRRVDGQEVIAPNSLLSGGTKLVHNFRRSKSTWEMTNLTVSYDTSMEVIERLRQKISTYMATNSREWSNYMLNIDKMDFQNSIVLVVAMEHRSNWQDWGGRWTRRTAFMRYLKTVLEELEVKYTMPIQPVILPQAPPNFGGSHGPPAPMMHQPPPGRHTIDSSMLGNAGFYHGGDGGRGSGPIFRTGVPSF